MITDLENKLTVLRNRRDRLAQDPSTFDAANELDADIAETERRLALAADLDAMCEEIAESPEERDTRCYLEGMVSNGWQIVILTFPDDETVVRTPATVDEVMESLLVRVTSYELRKDIYHASFCWKAGR